MTMKIADRISKLPVLRTIEEKARQVERFRKNQIEHSCTEPGGESRERAQADPVWQGLPFQ